MGEAEAYSVEAVGKAEAESMKLKAQAYKQYGEAAIMAMVLDSLPQVGHLFLHVPLSFVTFCPSYEFCYAASSSFINVLYSSSELFSAQISCVPLSCFVYSLSSFVPF